MLFSPNDLLSPSVPQLKLSGANWVEFAMRFCNVMHGKFLWGHFDATRTPAPSSRTSADSSHTPSYILGTNGEILDWDCYESLARSLLMTRLPTSTAFIVNELSSVQDMWNAVVSKYTYKGAFSQTRLRCDFLSL
ncbi:hypothetical protein P691DRAFT_683866 [Macrolepiota fuliginosa MF-IS2]|uniref:Uncharacterized protein n=1 Tax=Macrolepiota fuliginosa MF-IS2 TaxID=1400762 RepID=A0A9P6BXF2_9AGAR|nr:hypothetical protein P691DRAFT_683866 [Macrolepiota fuliginosa MF-IS2]